MGLITPICFATRRPMWNRIIEGATPDQLPVQLPTKFELMINLKAAKALGLSVPQSLLMAADKVVE
jgi:putative tryptophan/tyrosine transport system substrate-binding protein